MVRVRSLEELWQEDKERILDITRFPVMIQTDNSSPDDNDISAILVSFVKFVRSKTNLITLDAKTLSDVVPRVVDDVQEAWRSNIGEYPNLEIRDILS